MKEDRWRGSVFSVCKDPTGLRDAFYGFEKVEKRSCFVIYSYSKTVEDSASNLKGECKFLN